MRLPASFQTRFLQLQIAGENLSFLKKTDIYPVFISSKSSSFSSPIDYSTDVLAQNVFDVNFKGDNEITIINDFNYQFFTFKMNMYLVGKNKKIPEYSWVAIREEGTEKVGDIDDKERETIRARIEEDRLRLKEMIKKKTAKRSDIIKVVKEIEKSKAQSGKPTESKINLSYINNLAEELARYLVSSK